MQRITKFRLAVGAAVAPLVLVGGLALAQDKPDITDLSAKDEIPVGVAWTETGRLEAEGGTFNGRAAGTLTTTFVNPDHVRFDFKDFGSTRHWKIIGQEGQCRNSSNAVIWELGSGGVPNLVRADEQFPLSIVRSDVPDNSAECKFAVFVEPLSTGAIEADVVMVAFRGI